MATDLATWPGEIYQTHYDIQAYGSHSKFKEYV